MGHPTLQELSLQFDRVVNTNYAQRAAGEQLASLIAHTNALQKLSMVFNNLGEAGLVPMFEALSRSRTLKELLYYVMYEESISREFARDVILPAVCLNTSLRKLGFGLSGETLPELAEAHAIVAARTQPDAGVAAAV